MTPGVLRRIAALGVLPLAVAGLAACSGTRAPHATPGEAAATSSDDIGAYSSRLTLTEDPAGGSGGGAASSTYGASGRPEFHGRAEVTLHRGHQVIAPVGCIADARRNRLCGASGELTYVALGEPAAVLLTDAVMAQVPDHTAWLVRLRFADESSGDLRALSDRASRTGEFVLLRRGERVLTLLDPHQTERGHATVGPVTKAEAWSLVEQLAAP